ncbi:MAG: FAD-dependent oxidoreductase [Planctomycetaceae bacterium]
MANRETDFPKRFLQTDVLIVGAGGAGLRAAIEAKNRGVDVTVVSKGGFPSGCTPRSMGGMSAPFDERDSVGRHFKDTIEGGHHLSDPKLVRLLVDRACERALDLERYGTRFEKEGGRVKLFPYTGSSIPRGVLAEDPYQGGYIRGLVNEIKRLGIHTLGQVMITDFIKDRGAVIGAVGVELDGDGVILISARAAVLATGGGGELYRLTTNPAGTTGDGYALALKAGAELEDMEFVQGRVCMIHPRGMRGIPPPGDGLVTLGGRFYNALGERYMKNYFPDKMEIVTRAQMAIGAQKEIRAGRGTPEGGVYGDLSGVPQEELAKFKKFLQTCAAEHFDPSWQPYQWAPGAHHFMGGVVINTKCETGVPGLYAAGEVAAGVHGANRLAGNALTETQVFGAIAGAQAAARAMAGPQVPIPPEKFEPVIERLDGILRREGRPDSIEVKAELTEVMSLNVGVIRHEDGLRKATKAVDRIRKEKIPALGVGPLRSCRKLGSALEVENLALVAELIASAALMRTETRGAHSREDYPREDEKWAKNIVFQSEGGETKVHLRPVATLPGG